MDRSEEKRALRKRIRAQMAELPPVVQKGSDEALFHAFLSLREVEEAKTILLYYGVRGEPETARLIVELLARGKRVFLPKCLPQRQMEAREITGEGDLAPGALSIPEPTEACPVIAKDGLDLILVPALCCDKACYRLGQGGGYYDRYLKGYQGVTVGLCREAFLQEELPREPFDQGLTMVLTEVMRLVPNEIR